MQSIMFLGYKDLRRLLLVKGMKMAFQPAGSINLGINMKHIPSRQWSKTFIFVLEVLT